MPKIKKIALFKKYKCKLPPRDLNCYQLLFNLVMNAFWKIYYQEQRFSPLKHSWVFSHWHNVTQCVFLLVLPAKKPGAKHRAPSVSVLSSVVRTFVSFSFSIFNFYFNNINAWLNVKLCQIPPCPLINRQEIEFNNNEFAFWVKHSSFWFFFFRVKNTLLRSICLTVI